jgi:hypothetical protein
MGARRGVEVKTLLGFLLLSGVSVAQANTQIICHSPDERLSVKIHPKNFESGGFLCTCELSGSHQIYWNI